MGTDKNIKKERTAPTDAATLHKSTSTTARVATISPEVIEEEKPLEQSVLPDQPESLKGQMTGHRFKRFIATKKGKAIIILSALLVICIAVFSIPTTRYGLIGSFMKKDVHIVIVDSITNKPVSQVAISLGTHAAITGANGEVDIKGVPVGNYTFKADKKYYKEETQSYVVPILSAPKDVHESLQATGRQVTVHIVNKITQAVLAKAVLSVSGTSATTDTKGDATIVLPADQKSIVGNVTLTGYNQASVTVQVTDQINASNTFSLVPTGSLYYLSKATGTINVMKSDLDGSNASVVVQGKGTESDTDTVLLASRDWKYLALSANRDPSQKAQLYLIATATGKITTIDQGNAYFPLVGWSGHHFVYLVNRGLNQWEDKNQTLKSYDAESGTITTLDETSGTGSANYNFQSESIVSPYIVEGVVVYSKVWSLGDAVARPSDKKSAIMSVNPDGSQKQRLKEFSMSHSMYMPSRFYEPGGVYFGAYVDNADPSFYEYEDGAVKSATITADTFNTASYATYLLSPSSQKTLWYEPRDGKNTIFMGDQDAKSPITLANESDFAVYGWYGESYVLLSKGGSELYIAPAAANFGGVAPLKVTNYHKPAYGFYGYGSGYGGL